MEGGGDHERQPHAGDVPAHRFLRLQDIGDHLGEGTVVAHRAAQHERDAVDDARMHDAAPEDPSPDRPADAAAAADGVDRAHVVVVPVLRRDAARQVHAQRRAEQRRLDVVRGQPVAAEQPLHIARLDQALKERPAAGVDEGRPRHDEDLAPGAPLCPHGLGDAGDQPGLGFFRGDRAGHELEDVLLARALKRRHPHPFCSADDPLALADADHRHTARPRAPGLHHDPAVHLDALDGPPPPPDSHGRGEVGGRVERGREHPMLGGRRQPGIFQGDGHRAQAGQAGENRLEGAGGGRADFQAGGGRVHLALADGQVQDLEGPVEIHDLIQDLRQDERIDDVSADVDDLRGHRSSPRVGQ